MVKNHGAKSVMDEGFSKDPLSLYLTDNLDSSHSELDPIPDIWITISRKCRMACLPAMQASVSLWFMCLRFDCLQNELRRWYAPEKRGLCNLPPSAMLAAPISELAGHARRTSGGPSGDGSIGHEVSCAV